MAIRSGKGPASAPEVSTADDRLARLLRMLRWPTAVLWIAGIVVLVPLASGLAAVTNDTASAGLPSGAQSARVAQLQQEAQHASGRPVSQQAIVVFARPGGLTPGDLAAVTAARAAAGALDGRVGGLGSASSVQRSADGGAALFTIAVSSPQDSVTSVDTRAVTAVRQAIAPTPAGPATGCAWLSPGTRR